MIKGTENLHHVKADFHIHCAPYSHDSSSSVEQVAWEINVKNILLAAITNHNNQNGAEEVQKLVRGSGFSRFRAIRGEEVTTGDRNSKGKKIELLVYFVEEGIPSGFSIRDTIRKAGEQGAIVSTPHPYDKKRHGVAEGLDNIFAYAREFNVPVAIEVFNSRANSGQNKKAREKFEVAKKSGVDVLMTAGSDAHSPREIGRGGLNMYLTDEEMEGQITKDIVLRGLQRSVIVFGTDNRAATLVLRLLNRAALLKNKVARR